MAKGKIIPKNKSADGKRKLSSNVKPRQPIKSKSSKKELSSSTTGLPSDSSALPTKPAKKRKTSKSATIEIVEQDPDPYGDASEREDDGLDEDDLEFFNENEGAGGFLMELDKKGIARSKRETERLHNLNKIQNPLPKQSKRRARSPSLADTVSTIDSHPSEAPSQLDVSLNSDDLEQDLEGFSDEDNSEGLGGSDDDEALDASDLERDNVDLDIPLPHQSKQKKKKLDDDDLEAEYERGGRPRKYRKSGHGGEDSSSEEDSQDPNRGSTVKRLPIKLPSGQIQKVAGSTKLPSQLKKPVVVEDSEDESELEEEEVVPEGQGLGRRWGRAAVADVVGIKDPAARKRAVKEQIASLGAEIVGGGEIVDNLPLISRLQSFALPTVPNPNPEGKRIPNPISVRALAIASLLAIFKDLIPGYRIRELTEVEQAEKVRDDVKRQRDGEAGLVRTYAGYLKMLEKEIKERTPLGSLSLKCMCDLLSSLTHFNFRDNIMAVIVGKLSRKSWDVDSDICLQAITTVFKTDLTSTHSLPLVRLLARMIKERHYAVHPNVLSALWYVKVKAGKDNAYIKKPARHWDKDRDWKKKAQRGKGNMKGKGEGSEWSEKKKEWRTKKMRKDMRDKKEIEKEMDEAEAEVDEEEAGRNQTETLQHLFVLYFSIIKQTKKTPLLPAALEGLARFAHLVNIDFFRDLLVVLKTIIRGTKLDELDDASDDEDIQVDERTTANKTRLRLLGIVTAFELLSGQGEALNIDLNDFINDLYSLIPYLAFDPRLEEAPQSTITTTPTLSATNPGARFLHKKSQLAPSVDLFFRALNLVFFSPYASHSISPAWRAAAFAKRLLSASLHFPPKTALRSMEFVEALMVREPKVEALLSTEDRTADGVYRIDVEDPQVCNPFASSFFELGVLERSHWDEAVRKEAKKLGRHVRQ